MDEKKLSPNFSKICRDYIMLNQKIESLKKNGQIASEMRVPPIRLSLGRIYKECNLALFIAQNDFEKLYNTEERVQFKQTLNLFFSILDSDTFLQSVLLPLKKNEPQHYAKVYQYLSDLQIITSRISASEEQRNKLSFDGVKTPIMPVDRDEETPNK